MFLSHTDRNIFIHLLRFFFKKKWHQYFHNQPLSPRVMLQAIEPAESLTSNKEAGGAHAVSSSWPPLHHSFSVNLSWWKPCVFIFFAQLPSNNEIYFWLLSNEMQTFFHEKKKGKKKLYKHFDL